jgi:hypothetical protein
MPLTIEQQRAVAIAQAKRKRAEAEAKAPPSPLRAETDAIIEEAAAAIPGGYEAWAAKPADSQRMAALGYTPDPLAKSGYSRPRAPQAPIVDSGQTTNLFTDAMRMLEAPIAGLTGGASGGGLEGWAKTTTQNPLLGATEAVNFLSPVDEAGRAYLGLRDAGAGLIEGDMGKAAQGAQQASIEGSFAGLQALPGSMTLRGLTAPARVAPNTLAGAQRAAVQASRAPPVRKSAPQVVEAPRPFSAPPEPAGGGIVRRNADRIVGAGVGATIGGVGDAYAAPADGEGSSGPLNAGTGAAIGFFGPRAVASATSRGFRAAARPFRPAGFDERVAAKAVRDVLKSGGIRTADDAATAMTARFGDKPASVADLTQEGVGTTAGLSRLPGATGEAARARGEDLLTTRAGRLERDIGDATGASPATIAGDVDRMVGLAREQATPAYNALREEYPFGSLTSSRLKELRELDILKPHIKGVERYQDTLAKTENRVVGDFEFWDLVKRSLDDTEQAAIARGQPVPYDLDSARQAIVKEMDARVPGYAAARQLGGEAPKMNAAFRQGQGLLGGRYTAEDVSRLVQGVTGQPLTALQAGVIRSMVAKTEGSRGAMSSLMSAGSRRKLAQVFGAEAADAMQARFAADAAIMDNAQRINPNVGSVTSQAQMGGGGVVPMAAEAIRAFRSPVEAALAAMSRSGSYTKAQRDLMGQMLLDGATPENLARIYGRRGGPTRGQPTPPAGPPVNPLTPPRRPPEQSGFVTPGALAPLVGGSGGLAYGEFAPLQDMDRDGDTDAEDRQAMRMSYGFGGLVGGGLAGAGANRLLGPRRGAAPKAGPQKPPAQSGFGGGAAAPDVAAHVAMAKEQGFNTDKVYYHGAAKQFEQFDMSKVGQREIPWYGKGAYLSPDKEVARRYATSDQNVMPFFVRGKLLKVDKDSPPPEWLKNSRDWSATLTERGYSGLEIGGKIPELVVFNPSDLIRATPPKAVSPDAVRYTAKPAPWDKTGKSWVVMDAETGTDTGGVMSKAFAEDLVRSLQKPKR